MDGEYIKALGFQNRFVYHLRDRTSNHRLHRLLAFLCIPSGLLKSIRKERESYKKKIAVVAIAKNEGSYLREWVSFYQNQGFDNIILFDNDSTDETANILKPFIESGFVIYRKISGKMRQYDAYHIAVDDYKHTYKYLAFLDCDEFLFCKNSTVYEFVDSILSKSKIGGGWSQLDGLWFLWV